MSMQPGGMLPGLDQPQGPDNKRLLITVGLVTALWMGFQAFNPPQPPKPDAAAEADAGPGAPTTTTGTGEQPSLSAAPATPETIPVEQRAITKNVAQASGADAVAVKGGYRAELTNQGAQLDGFHLDGYLDRKGKDTKGEPSAIDLAGAENAGARSVALRTRAGSDVQLAADAGYAITASDDNHVVFERLTPQGVRITRTYTFDDKRFAFTHEVVVKNESSEKRTAAFDVVLTGQERPSERDEGGMFAATPDALAGACRVKGDREHFTSKKVEKEPKTFEGAVDYAALDRHYFLAALVFEGIPTERCLVKPFSKVSSEANAPVAHGFQIVVEQAPLTLAPGEVKSFKHEAYFGPKQVGLLQDFGHNLGENIDFGIFGVISRPMLWVLVQLHKYTGNFGIAIILLTLLMKIITFPLTQKSYVSMQQVKKLKPEIDALQKKYGNDRAALGQKQMELYKEKGINPLAGCFPVLVQMPIWFALYRTLSQAVELYQQPFAMGIMDLTQPDQLLPFGISLLPLIVGGLMLGQTFLQPPPDDQPQMKYMMWFMPFMFTFLMLQMASGLSIYMITNSLLTMAQQFYIKKKYA
jgi:YidC/Oxa1 family membrane protein insertase